MTVSLDSGIATHYESTAWDQSILKVHGMGIQGTLYLVIVPTVSSSKWNHYGCFLGGTSTNNETQWDSILDSEFDTCQHQQWTFWLDIFKRMVEVSEQQYVSGKVLIQR